MGKRKILIMAVFFVVACCVFGIGLIRKQNRTMEENVSTATKRNELDESEEIMNRIAEDEKKVTSKGNIYEEGEYQSFGGFGYQVIRFEVFNSYDAFMQMPGYNKEKEWTSIFNFPESQFVYVTVHVTNESMKEQIFYPDGMEVIFAQNGHAGIESMSDLIYNSACFYIDGVEHPADDTENFINPLMQPGETITLHLGYEYSYIDDNDGHAVKVEDVIKNPEYYVQIEGTLTSGERVYSLSKDYAHIYFRCIPEGAEDVE